LIQWTGISEPEAKEILKQKRELNEALNFILDNP